MRILRIIALFYLWVDITQVHAFVLNNPYPAAEKNQKIYYSSFNEPPKTLDPARSYNANEFQFISQIYEPPLQYDYYKRPYTLIPLTAAKLPDIRYEDNQGHSVPQNSPSIRYTIYRITIKPHLFFQPHPAFAKDIRNEPLYLNLSSFYISLHDIKKLSDFKKTDTREVTAEDYIYQIKRLANPQVSSPIYGLMSDYIDGFSEYQAELPQHTTRFIDLRKFPLKGLKLIDRYTFEITLKGEYAQFIFWLAMPFFSPIPWEADQFYAQPGMQERNITFEWYPVGTGPFMLSENNPNKRMVLMKNPYFHTEYFKDAITDEDKEAHFNHSALQKLPLIDKAIFTLEKESIPRWNKFLQGYYDASGISNDSYDQAIHINKNGDLTLSQVMKDKHLHLIQTHDPSIFYLGFNMLDPIVGGQTERARKLRLAISIAVNYEENISLFYNGRGEAAQGPIPPGIFGFKEGKEGINPYVYEWKNNTRSRLPLSTARKLLQEAGYPNGIDPATGQALLLHYDVPMTSGPDDKSVFEWMRKQFRRLGINLDIRATQYNRFQDKMRTGNAQIFSWGWNADYPDPENFLFMLYGKNAKVAYGGENASNYQNKAYDRLFIKMKNRPNDITRQKIIDEMVNIVRHDAPLIWGINTDTLLLTQNWIAPIKPNTISLGGLKYIQVNPKERTFYRRQWNQANLYPVMWLFLFLLLSFIPLFWTYYFNKQKLAKRMPQ